MSLYNSVLELITKLTRRNKKVNYDAIIDTIRESLGEYLDLQSEKTWSNEFEAPDGILYHTFTKKILVLPEKIISGHGTVELLDTNHCLMQIFRIPLHEKLTVFNLLRIAVYNGMLKNTIKVDDFPQGIVKAYRSLKIPELFNYIDSGEAEKLFAQIPEDTVKQLLSAVADTGSKA